MSVHQITHSRKDGRDADRRIDALAFGGYVYPIDTIIAWIESGVHTFYVLVWGRRVAVVVRRHSNLRKYLTTEGDGFPPNNLLNLPDC